MPQTHEQPEKSGEGNDPREHMSAFYKGPSHDSDPLYFMPGHFTLELLGEPEGGFQKVLLTDLTAKEHDPMILFQPTAIDIPRDPHGQ